MISINHYTKRGRNMDQRKMNSEPVVEEYEDSYEDEGNSFGRRIPLDKFLVIMLTVITVFMALIMWQNNQKNELEKQEAYLVPVMINLQEENLLLEYGFLPSDVGLGEIRSAWVANPCYETAHVYSDALEAVLDYLSGDSKTHEIFIRSKAVFQV